ncbi:MAG TPA: hypothetical protein VFS00_01265 [Polyangiaceae bacterium]|nr:hypothetical protein [Polyangiaceae bacterium]
MARHSTAPPNPAPEDPPVTEETFRAILPQPDGSFYACGSGLNVTRASADQEPGASPQGRARAAVRAPQSALHAGGRPPEFGCRRGGASGR